MGRLSSHAVPAEELKKITGCAIFSTPSFLKSTIIRLLSTLISVILLKFVKISDKNWQNRVSGFFPHQNHRHVTQMNNCRYVVLRPRVLIWHEICNFQDSLLNLCGEETHSYKVNYIVRIAPINLINRAAEAGAIIWGNIPANVTLNSFSGMLPDFHWGRKRSGRGNLKRREK